VKVSALSNSTMMNFLEVSSYLFIGVTEFPAFTITFRVQNLKVFEVFEILTGFTWKQPQKIDNNNRKHPQSDLESTMLENLD
jgi:hypothetical protein